MSLSNISRCLASTRARFLLIIRIFAYVFHTKMGKKGEKTCRQVPTVQAEKTRIQTCYFPRERARAFYVRNIISRVFFFCSSELTNLRRRPCRSFLFILFLTYIHRVRSSCCTRGCKLQTYKYLALAKKKKKEKRNEKSVFFLSLNL